MGDRRVIVAFSGGIDSTLALAQQLHEGKEVIPVTIQTPFVIKKQRKFIWRLLGHYNLQAASVFFDMRDIVELTQPTTKGGAYEDYIPGYQCLLYMPILAVADKLGVEKVVTGTTLDTTRGGKKDVFVIGRHIDDDTPVALNEMASFYNSLYDTDISFVLPFGGLTKVQAMKQYEFLNIPYRLINSCENIMVNHGYTWHCGKCHKCLERSQAFMELGWEDPVVYESDCQ